MTDLEYQTTLYSIKSRSDWSINVIENNIEIITYLLYMSIMKLPRIGNIGHHPLLFLESQMPVNSFLELKMFLDFFNNAKMNKIHPLIEKWNKNNAMSTKRIKI